MIDSRRIITGESGKKNFPSPLVGEGQGEGGEVVQDTKLHSYARRLRGNQTDVERKLWRVLRNRQFQSFKFRRQHPIGRYIVDLCCLERKLVIEL